MYIPNFIMCHSILCHMYVWNYCYPLEENKNSLICSFCSQVTHTIQAFIPYRPTVQHKKVSKPLKVKG